MCLTWEYFPANMHCPHNTLGGGLFVPGETVDDSLLVSSRFEMQLLCLN